MSQAALTCSAEHSRSHSRSTCFPACWFWTGRPSKLRILTIQEVSLPGMPGRVPEVVLEQGPGLAGEESGKLDFAHGRRVWPLTPNLMRKCLIRSYMAGCLMWCPLCHLAQSMASQPESILLSLPFSGGSLHLGPPEPCTDLCFPL